MTQQNILVISGKKQSGKDTVCNFLHGYIMQNVGITRDFFVDELGRLNVYSATPKEDGSGFDYEMRGLNVNSESAEFCKWASSTLWKYVKSYHFADSLKGICKDLFGLSHQQVYGTDADKNTNTKIKWQDIYFALPPRKVGGLKKEGKTEEFLTARELMQFFGTDICRKIYNPCWTEQMFNLIKQEEVPMAIVADCRFSNEVEAAKEAGAKVLRLTRSVYDSEHQSENDLNEYGENDFDAYIDNQNMTIDETNQAVLEQIKEWGWLNFEEKVEVTV